MIPCDEIDDTDPDGQWPDPYDVWKDNELSGQNAEWARVDDQMISGN